VVGGVDWQLGGCREFCGERFHGEAGRRRMLLHVRQIEYIGVSGELSCHRAAVTGNFDGRGYCKIYMKTK
jgi:hypothetical protein